MLSTDTNNTKQNNQGNQLNYTPLKSLDGQESYLPSKEGEPIRAEFKNIEDNEIILKESEPKIEDHELEGFIEQEEDNKSIEIHPDLKKAGLKSVDSASLDPKQRVHLPISDDQVMEGLEEPISSSFRWLAEVARFMLNKSHIGLKKFHGKVIRVLKR